MNKITKKEENCLKCICDNADMYNSFINNCSNSFFSGVCFECKQIEVPAYINRKQVINYLKVYFKKRNISIEEYFKNYHK